MSQRIVCAANKLSDGKIIIGVRHWDSFMHQSVNEYISTFKDNTHEQTEQRLLETVEQGFIDQHGTFLTREEAWIIAEQNGQIVRTGSGFSGPALFSENLY